MPFKLLNKNRSENVRIENSAQTINILNNLSLFGFVYLHS